MTLRLTLALVTLAAAQLSAHDFWLATVGPATPGAVTITAGVGEKFPTRTQFRYRDNWLAEWTLVGEKSRTPLSKDWRRDAMVMATDVTLPGTGAFMGVAMVSAQTIEMTGDEFTDYLKEEGLDSVIAARQSAGEAGKTTKERYARYAKIALRNGEGSGAHLTRPVGAKAEFVPSVDPTTLRAGSPLTVQLLIDGKPVSGASLTAIHEGMPQKARTDASGRATFTIDRPGAWLVKTVHMVRQPAGNEAEWESFWVTLAFQGARG